MLPSCPADAAPANPPAPAARTAWRGRPRPRKPQSGERVQPTAQPVGQWHDVNVNRVTPELFRKYPTVEAFAALNPEELEPDVRSTGFFRNKAKSVVGAAKKVVADFGGQVPLNMNDLLTLPGVARKTANVVLGSWFKIAEGVVVDTHVQRISRRLELTTNTDPQKIEQDLMRIIPREKWILFAHQLIWHGRKLCIARKPKCIDCLLENICHAADKTWSTVEMHKSANP